MAVQLYGIHWQNNATALCFIGGLLLGIIASCRMLILGRVTGISGFVSGLIHPKIQKFSLDERKFRLASIVGLVVRFFSENNISAVFTCCAYFLLQVGGALAQKYIPESIQDWSCISHARLIIAGILVGYGTVLGNGCTSGHGICGISAFRFRSLVATCCFMGAGIATAIASNTSRLLPFFTNTVPISKGGEIVAVMIAVCVVLVFVARILSKAIENENHTATATATQQMETSLTKVSVAFKLLAEFLFGVAISLALAVSNMTQLSATIAFLDLRYWNPALAFVMIGAIGVSLPSFYTVFKQSTPLLHTKFERSALSEIDINLVGGAIIFGVGWG